eukprot:Polyplicarium_translucidae@DN236_c0_g1_i2.p1
MVLDAKLPEHLQRFGIHIQSMSKTEKSTEELSIERNKNFEWSRITESQVDLEPARGPGLYGFKNIGNSCYIGAVLNALFAVRSFVAPIQETGVEIVKSLPPRASVSGDIGSQLWRLVEGEFGERLAGRRAALESAHVETLEALEPSRREGTLNLMAESALSPGLLKAVLAKAHPQFANQCMQDSEEFLRHLLHELKQHERILSLRCPSFVPFANVFEFEVEKRLHDLQSNQCRYSSDMEVVLSVPVPLDAATNAARATKRQKTDVD